MNGISTPRMLITGSRFTSVQVSLLESDKIRLMDAVEHVTGHPLGHVADPIPADVRQHDRSQSSPSRASRQLQKSSAADDTMTKTMSSIIRMIGPQEARQVGHSLQATRNNVSLAVRGCLRPGMILSCRAHQVGKISLGQHSRHWLQCVSSSWKGTLFDSVSMSSLHS